MKIILRQDVEKLGKAGQVVAVKDGFARNFLIPKGLALIINPGNVRILEEEKKKEQRCVMKAKHDIELLAERLSDASCTIRVAAQDNKLFGSVGAAEIAKAFQEEGIEIDKKQIDLAQPIKEVGVFRIPIKLNHETSVEVKVWVVKE